jgi:protein-L-isoaspartate(D-aspartate) O-methyltransferase
LAAAGFDQVKAVCADGGYGYPEDAPYDRIILTVGAPDITPAWWNQLNPDGRIVLPLLLQGSMKSIAFERVDDHLVSISVNDCGFIALRGDFATGFPERVQVGPDPGLYVERMGEFPIDRDEVYRLLTGTHKDWKTDLEVQVWDVLNGNLWTWLALHEPHMCKLVAEGDMVERDIVPLVLGIDGRQKSSGTAILLEQSGLAALMRPPDNPVPLVPFDKLFAPDSPAKIPFQLFVRQFGTDELITQRLLHQIEQWKSSGSPTSEKMHLRAYPKELDYKPSESEIVLEKQWTKLVIEWSA